MNSSRGSGGAGFDRGCADGRAAEDSSLSDLAAGYSGASSGSIFQNELADYGYREDQELVSAAYTRGGSVNFTSALSAGQTS